MLVTPAAATHRARGRVIHVAGFSHLLFHYIHRRIAQDKKILNAHNLYNPGSQSSKNNNQHTPYVRLREGYMFGACFSCALVWFEGDLHSLYLHTDKYMFIHTNKAVSRHSISSTFCRQPVRDMDDSTLSHSVSQTIDGCTEHG